MGTSEVVLVIEFDAFFDIIMLFRLLNRSGMETRSVILLLRYPFETLVSTNGQVASGQLGSSSWN